MWHQFEKNSPGSPQSLQNDGSSLGINIWHHWVTAWKGRHTYLHGYILVYLSTSLPHYLKATLHGGGDIVLNLKIRLCFQTLWNISYMQPENTPPQICPQMGPGKDFPLHIRSRWGLTGSDYCLLFLNRMCVLCPRIGCKSKIRDHVTSISKSCFRVSCVGVMLPCFISFS